MSFVDPNEYSLTTSQVASRAYVTKSTIQRWARLGMIPSAETLGGHRRFRPADVEALLDRMKRGERPTNTDREGEHG